MCIGPVDHQPLPVQRLPAQQGPKHQEVHGMSCVSGALALLHAEDGATDDEQYHHHLRDADKQTGKHLTSWADLLKKVQTAYLSLKLPSQKVESPETPEVRLPSQDSSASLQAEVATPEGTPMNHT